MTNYIDNMDIIIKQEPDDEIIEIKKKCDGEIIKLNVGGTKFETSWDTLKICNYFQNLLNKGYKKLNEYFIDRDPDSFKYILQFLRTKKLPIHTMSAYARETLLEEAKYFYVGWFSMSTE
eukprot:UN27281